jgi:hypothetical protein
VPSGGALGSVPPPVVAETAGGVGPTGAASPASGSESPALRVLSSVPSTPGSGLAPAGGARRKGRRRKGKVEPGFAVPLIPAASGGAGESDQGAVGEVGGGGGSAADLRLGMASGSPDSPPEGLPRSPGGTLGTGGKRPVARVGVDGPAGVSEGGLAVEVGEGTRAVGAEEVGLAVEVGEGTRAVGAEEVGPAVGAGEGTPAAGLGAGGDGSVGVGGGGPGVGG